MYKSLALTALLLATSTAQTASLGPALEAFHEGRFGAASEQFARHENNPQARYYLARIAMRDEIDDAEAHVQKAMDLAPDEARYQFLCGQIMADQASNAFFSALGYAKKSKNCFERAVELEPENPSYLTGLIQFYAQAPGIAGGDDDKAAALTSRLAQTHPGHAARLRLGELSGEQRQDALRQALQAHPNNDSLQFYKGLTAQQDGDHTSAMASFEDIIERHDKAAQPPAEYHNALYQVARSALVSGERIARGVETMQRYLALPNIEGRQAENYWAHLRLAQLLLASGEQASAQPHLAKARLSEDAQLIEVMREAGL